MARKSYSELEEENDDLRDSLEEIADKLADLGIIETDDDSDDEGN